VRGVSEHTPSKPLELAEEALNSVLDETVDSVEHLNYFIRLALPKIVKSLLTRRCRPHLILQEHTLAVSRLALASGVAAMRLTSRASRVAIGQPPGT
jgi:hypothetical protein